MTVYDVFSGALPQEVRAGLDPSVVGTAVAERVAEVLDIDFLQAGQARWPGVRVAPAELVASLARRMDGRASVLEQLEELHAADLYLALACGLGDDGAVAAFEGAFGADIERAVRKAGGERHGVDDLAQRVREKLFVGDGQRPARICAYAGRGHLAAWVRVTAVRTVLDVVRWDSEKKRRVDLDARMLEQVGAAEVTPEADYLRIAHADRIPEAMRRAFEALTARQRNLLRHRFLHGLGTEEIAKLYQVHRATAYRWQESARVALFDGTRIQIKRDLAVSGAELESLMQAFRSRIDISMGKLLGRDLERESDS